MSLDIKKILVGVVIALSHTNTWAMLGSDEENNTPSSGASRAITISSKEDQVPYSVSLTSGEIPGEVLGYLFSFLDVVDFGRASQVSKHWQRVAADPVLWRSLGLRKYGEYLTEEDLKENPRENVVFHFLSVWVNALSDVNKINIIVRKYKLNLYKPFFKAYIPFIYLGTEEASQIDIDLITKILDREIFIAQGHRQAIRFKFEGLLETSYKSIYEKDYNKAREFNEELIENGDQVAIKRKLEGLAEGKYGYVKDLQALKEFNDRLTEKGDEEAIARKIEALWRGGEEYSTPRVYTLYERDRYRSFSKSSYAYECFSNPSPIIKTYTTYGYKREPSEARRFNESLVTQGNSRALVRKFEGLYQGKYGYEKNLQAARELNDALIEKGDQEAIKRRIEGLAEGKYGYEKQPELARELNEVLLKAHNDILRKNNETLIEKGDPTAIRKKIFGLAEGKDGYEKDLEAARQLNDAFIEKGDPEAVDRKIRWLRGGYYGYEKNFEGAMELEVTFVRARNEALVEKGDQEAIERKVRGLAEGIYGYQKNPILARELNENLVKKGDQEAIRRKVEGLAGGKYGSNEGVYGYEKNPAAAREFNDVLVEQGDFEAIRRKIYGLRFTDGGYGYKGQNENAALKLEMILIEKGDQEAIKHRFEELGHYSSNKNHTAAARKFNESLVKKGNLEAKKRKIEGLSSSQYGYEQNFEEARISIETDLIINANPIARGIGHYLKVLGLKYGLFGYERDRPKAIEYVKKYNVPF